MGQFSTPRSEGCRVAEQTGVNRIWEKAAWPRPDPFVWALHLIVHLSYLWLICDFMLCAWHRPGTGYLLSINDQRPHGTRPCSLQLPSSSLLLLCRMLPRVSCHYLCLPRTRAPSGLLLQFSGSPSTLGPLMVTVQLQLHARFSGFRRHRAGPGLCLAPWWPVMHPATGRGAAADGCVPSMAELHFVGILHSFRRHDPH